MRWREINSVRRRLGFVIEKKESFGRVCSVSTEGSWCGRGGGGIVVEVGKREKGEMLTSH